MERRHRNAWRAPCGVAKRARSNPAAAGRSRAVSRRSQSAFPRREKKAQKSRASAPEERARAEEKDRRAVERPDDARHDSSGQLGSLFTRRAQSLDDRAECAHDALISFPDQRGKNVLADPFAPKVIAAIAARISGGIEIHPVVLSSA